MSVLILSMKKSREPEGPLASVRGGRDVSDRPWCKVITVEYYRFLIVFFVGPPILPHPVWLLKCTHFLELNTNLASV